MVGVPGLALPDSALATAMLPSVPDMVDASIANSRLARKVAQQPPSPERPAKHASCECPLSRMQRNSPAQCNAEMIAREDMLAAHRSATNMATSEG